MTAATLDTTTSTAGLAAAADEDLISRVADGDRDALGELYRRHRGVVRGYVLTRISRGDDADDVVQETFLRASTEARGYRPEDGFRVPVWLCWQAGAQLREYGRHEVHPYLSAARASREQARRPVTETAEHREATPLSERVHAAMARLTPGERRAIQLRYIDGLNPEQAAEIVGVRKRSFHRRVMYGRRKLAEELAYLAPQARSLLQDLPRREAIKRALVANAADVPAAVEWLRKQGVRASEANLYRYRQMIQAGEPLPGERAQPRPSMRPAYPAYTPPEHVTAAGSALARARAAGVDYRTRFGYLPTRREVMDAFGVSESTATRALRPLKAQPDARQVGSGEADESRSDTRPATSKDRPGIDRAGIARGEPSPAADDEPTGRHRPRGAHLHDPDAREADQSQRPVTDPSTRHPVKVNRQSAAVTTSADRTEPGHLSTAAAVDTYATTGRADRPDSRHRGRGADDALAQARAAGNRRGERPAPRTRHTTEHSTGETDPGGRRPPGDGSADVSIAQARAAVAVLVAHRAVQAQRRQAEQYDSERLARWRADDRHDTAARSDAEGMSR